MVVIGSHTVVLGAGIAGLLAARVLSEFYVTVTVVERDVLPRSAEQRKGAPQGRHLHTFLSSGTQVLGELFPGILDELADAGAVVDDGDDLSRVYARVGSREVKPAGRLRDPGPLAAYQASRPFMEFHIRRRVAALENVTLLDNHDVAGPVIDGGTITGVRIINRANGISTSLDARLVVDAMGRASRTQHFLEDHGFGATEENRLPPTGGYSSQLLRIAPGRITERMAFVNQGNIAPGALLVAYEHDTWMLAVARPIESGAPPSDFDEMMEVCGRLLPAPIMAGLRDADPVGPISISRSTDAAWRRYDRNLDQPTGLIVIGDALCYLNPLHGQGMTMAALQAVALRDCLQAGEATLPRRFYRAAAKCIGPVWAMNRANDQPPSLDASRTVRHRALVWTQRAVVNAAAADIGVYERILRVRNLIDPPKRLQDPRLFARIVLANLRHPRLKPQSATNLSHSRPLSDAALRYPDDPADHFT
nr:MULTISPECIES: FAD-dependent oxidoreductase [unclassified Mycolicibacterium]